jgi:hypothetical protein
MTPKLRTTQPAIGLGACLFFIALSGLQAQTNLAINWSSIDGGGGSSTGGIFTISGTIGQPDPGQMSGGNYSIEGGFWGILAAAPPLEPLWLAVARTTTNSVIIWWPSPATGWKLHQNANLSTTNWSEVLTTPNDDGVTRSVTVAPPLGNQFYRLKKP